MTKKTVLHDINEALCQLNFPICLPKIAFNPLLLGYASVKYNGKINNFNSLLNEHWVHSTSLFHLILCTRSRQARTINIMVFSWNVHDFFLFCTQRFTITVTLSCHNNLDTMYTTQYHCSIVTACTTLYILSWV